jgi:predicted enzyme related to lactoylglutathione lyase
MSPVSWIEIYVEDMDRARSFYESVFSVELNEIPMEGIDSEIQMYVFGSFDNHPGIALVKNPHLQPGSGGTIVYFSSKDCSIEESKVLAAGGKIIQEKTGIEDFGYYSLLMDSEGNPIGVHSMF